MSKQLTTRIFGIAMLCGMPSIGLLSVGTSAVAQEKVVDFSIPAGPLGDVLTQIGAAASSPISFSPKAVEGLRSGAISGRMSVGQAVARALAGSKLRAVLGASGTLTITGGAANQARGAGSVATDIPDIDVSGGSYAGGSSDPLATQGTHTYAATDANIATKSPLSIKETPQSVSVVTAQQIEDRHLTTLDQAVEATPGLITQTGGGQSGSNLDTAYYSRGFQINSFSIDGGSPLQVGGGGNVGFKPSFMSAFDLSEYDSIAVLRGSGGQYSGMGDPGGTLSLERKRPLDHMAASVDQSFGSFQAFRTVGDISSGQLLDGHLRIRSTFVNDDQHYFYEFAKKYVDQFYLNAELNLTPTTLINLGGSYNSTRANPWLQGLPTYVGGSFVNFPRSMCLCAPWGKTTIGTQEYFLQVKQDLGPDWQLHFNSSIQKQAADNNYLNYTTANNFTGANNFGVTPGTNNGISLFAQANQNHETQELADLYVNGRVSPFGILVEPTFGGSIQYISDGSPGSSLEYDYPNSTSLNLFRYNGSQLPPVPLSQYSVNTTYDAGTNPTYKQTQIGGYGSLRISPVPWAHLLVSERVSAYDQNQSITLNEVTTSQRIRQFHAPIPDVGLTFDLTHETSIYGSYTTIYQLSNSLSVPNGPLIPPIQGATWEAGVKRSDYGGRLNSSVAYYHATETGIPVPNPAYPTTQAPGSILSCCFFSDGTKSDSQGVDVEVSGKVLPNTDLTFSYNYNQNTTTTGSLAATTLNGTQAPGSVSKLNFLFPRHIVKLFAVVTPETHIAALDEYARRMKLGFGVDFRSTASNSGQYTVYDANFNASTQSYNVTQPSYAVFSAMAKYDITDRAFAQLNVYNLFNRKYYQTIGTYGGGNWYGQPMTLVGSVHVAF